TKLFFCEPVLTDDGYFYEYMAIKNHLAKSNMSPSTNNKMGNMILKAPILKKMVEEFLELNPDYKNYQFSFKKPFYLFQNDFLDNLVKKRFDKLYEFTSVILNTEIDESKTTVFEFLCRNCQDVELIRYILDNSNDIDVYDKRKTKPIHLACRYAPFEII